MVTLKEVAELAGVSVPTVSKILNNKNQKCASQETQERIWRAVRELGYRPNIHAKKIASIPAAATEKSIIAVCLCGSQDPFFRNYYDAVRRALEVRILSLGYTPYTCGIDQLMEKKSPIPGQKIIGAVMVGDPDETLLHRLSKIIPNLAILSLADKSVPCDRVFCSFQNAVRKAVAETSGSICFVGQGEASAAAVCREYKGRLIRILDSDYTMSGGYISGMLLAGEGGIPETIICEGRELALGIQKAFSDREIPKTAARFLVLDDLCRGLCGAAGENPYKSAAVDLAGEECAGLALDLLIDRIQHRHKLFVTYEADSQILSPVKGGI